VPHGFAATRQAKDIHRTVRSSHLVNAFEETSSS